MLAVTGKVPGLLKVKLALQPKAVAAPKSQLTIEPAGAPHWKLTDCPAHTWVLLACTLTLAEPALMRLTFSTVSAQPTGSATISETV